MLARRLNNIIIRNYMVQTSIPLNEQIETKIKLIEDIISNQKQKNEYGYNQYISKTELNQDNDKIIGKLNEIKKLTKDLYIYRS